MAALWHVQVRCSDGRLNERLLRAGESLVIGRGRGSDWLVADAGLSRMHCSIQVSASGLEVIDLKSSNGIYQNWQRVSRAVLGAGEDLTLGPSVRLTVLGVTDGSARGAGEGQAAYDFAVRRPVRLRVFIQARDCGDLSVLPGQSLSVGGSEAVDVRLSQAQAVIPDFVLSYSTDCVRVEDRLQSEAVSLRVNGVEVVAKPLSSGDVVEFADVRCVVLRWPGLESGLQLGVVCPKCRAFRQLPSAALAQLTAFHDLAGLCRHERDF